MAVRKGWTERATGACVDRDVADLAALLQVCVGVRDRGVALPSRRCRFMVRVVRALVDSVIMEFRSYRRVACGAVTRAEPIGAFRRSACSGWNRCRSGGEGAHASLQPPEGRCGQWRA